MRFNVKIDLWLRLVMYVSAFLVIPIIFIVPQDEILIAVFVAILNMAMILPFIVVCFYELREDHLFIRFGFIHKRIKYKNISEIIEKKGLTNGYALSSDRIRIKESHKKSMMAYTEISPEDKERFIFELKSRCPQLQVDLY